MPEQFQGLIEIIDNLKTKKIIIEPNDGRIRVGGNDDPGRIWLYPDGSNIETHNASMSLNAGTTRLGSGASITVGGLGVNSALYLLDNTNNIVFSLLGNTKVFQICQPDSLAGVRLDGNNSSLELSVRTGNRIATTIKLDGNSGRISVGGQDKNGDIDLFDANNQPVIRLRGQSGHLYIGGQGKDGDIYVRDANNQQTIRLHGQTGDLHVGGGGQAGDIYLRATNNQATIRLHAQSGNLYVGGGGQAGDIYVRDANNQATIRLHGRDGNLRVGGGGQNGDIYVRDANDRLTIRLNGDAGDIILLNADCAEDFDIAADEDIEPGMAMVLDEDSRLRPCRTTYDRKVAGVISGGGGCKPGIVLDRQESDPTRKSVALVGKVFCRVDADYGSISVGDLLTTSNTLGHAMKATDPTKSFGAVIGKAMQPLQTGKDMIPILVALQ